MLLSINQADLLRELGRDTVDLGHAVRRSGAIRKTLVADDGAIVSGSVQGSRRKPYSQIISFGQRGDTVTINGHCSCPMSRNCKHVAAVLLEYVASGGSAWDLQPSPRETVLAQGSTLPAANPPPPATPAFRPALSQPVASWLDRLSALANPPPETAPQQSANQRVLLFVLNHELPSYAVKTAAPVRIRAVTMRVRKDGSLTDQRYFALDNMLRGREQRPRFFTEDDEAVLRDLHWLARSNGSHQQEDVTLEPGMASARLLDQLLRSGQLRFGTAQGPALSPGPARRATPQWIKSGQDAQQLVFMPEAGEHPEATERNGKAESGFDLVLPLSPPYYVGWGQGLAGQITCDLPPSLALEIAKAPVIAASEAAVVKAMLRERLAISSRPADEAVPTDVPPAGQAPACNTALTLLPLPEAPDNVETRRVTPIPRLELFMADAKVRQNLAWYVANARYQSAFKLPVARLAFDYAGEIVPIHAKLDTLERLDGPKLILTPRDHRFEVDAMQRLQQFGLKATNGLPIEIADKGGPCLFLAPAGNASVHDFMANFDDPSRFIAFSAEALPSLMQDGWQVAYSGDYPYQIAEGATAWWADVGEASGIDWFSFELGIEFEGHRINLVPQLASMLAGLPADLLEFATSNADTPEARATFERLCAKLQLYHSLPDGRLLPLPGDRLAPLLRSLLELIGPRQHNIGEDGTIKLHRAEAGALARFREGAGTEVAWAANTERLLELGQKLRGGVKLQPVKPPRSFKASLRAYQSEGLGWLQFLREAGFGGVLADDMGLGKTVQALAFLAGEKAAGRLDKPALIISPTSVLPNWQAEVEKFAPNLSVLALRGLERRAQFGQIAQHDLVLTTYPLLARDHEVLLKQEFHIAILDEAQAIKNPRATISGIAHRINARHRLALTGTPLENNLGEVWSLFQFLAPGLLGDETTFRRTFRTPIEKHGDMAAQSFLSRRLRPFMLRRTKAEVATELPPKTEIVERIRLEGSQRDLYETVRALMHAKVRDEIAKKGIAKSHIIFLDALLKLRQICCDPRLLKMPQARKVKGSAKLERLMEMVPELVGEGRRILLFSQFTSMLDLIKVELDALKIPFVEITGSTTDRATPVREFQAGKVPLFLLSLKAGGTGLNLTAADTVIHYDPWWNPAVENQATDRAYRIGQDKPVFVHKLIVEEGIEEAIELLKARKAALAEALFAGGSKTPLDLSEADISALFAPLGAQRLQRREAA